MAIRLAKDILHFLREQAAPTSLKKLQREGIQNATVLDMDQIEDLVTRAVDRVLRQSNIDPSRTAQLGRDAREEFLRLLHDRDSLRETVDALSREHDELQKNFSRLRKALGQAQQDLDEERARAAAAAAASREEAVEAKLQPFLRDIKSEIILRLQRSPAGLRPEIERCLEDLPLKLAQVARGYLDRETARVLDEERRARQDRIGHLERRVTKLKGALAETETMLDRVRTTRPSGAGGAADADRAAIYSEAQGLPDDEPGYHKKKGLLSEIFRLNLELRDLINHEPEQP
ncbi:MAG: hypothetical protein AB1486_23605 [Planctomycetota bacterium]